MNEGTIAGDEGVEDSTETGTELTEEQAATRDNLMEGAEISQDPIDRADYDRLVQSCLDAEGMMMLPCWKGMYAEMVNQIKTAKSALVDCKGADVKKYQEAIKAYKYLIMKQVEKAEFLNSYIKDNPLFVIADSKELTGAEFDFEDGTLRTFTLSNKAKSRLKLIGSFDFPLY